MSWAGVLGVRNPGDGFAADLAGSGGGALRFPQRGLVHWASSSYRHLTAAAAICGRTDSNDQPSTSSSEMVLSDKQVFALH